MSVAETNTRMIPTDEITDDVLNGLHAEAATLVIAAMSAQSDERARPLPRHTANMGRPLYLGRHRTPPGEDTRDRIAGVEPAPAFGPKNWVVAPPTFDDPVQEKTAALALVDVPLPPRKPGAALEADPTPPPARTGLRGLLEAFLRGVR